ncbi:MAG: 1,4-dihydroxy-2-naphthoate octaprenyltransferase, partial [Myxococcales bacterium]|nr:1,4-dihydroxy-2-naphthoate octaprenyltransferase [Myxococcales bacterium]
LYLIWVGGWPILAVGVAAILAALAYTGGPWPLAYVGLGDPFVLVFFGPVAVAGTTYVQTLRLDPASLVGGTALGLLATAILVVNNLRDREGDARANKRTLAVRFGARAARVEYALCVFGAYALLPLVWACGWGGPGWLLPALSLPLALYQVRCVATLDGRALNPHLGATARLQLVFALL